MPERRGEVKLEAGLVGGELHDAARRGIVTAGAGLPGIRIQDKGVVEADGGGFEVFSDGYGGSEIEAGIPNRSQLAGRDEGGVDRKIGIRKYL